MSDAVERLRAIVAIDNVSKWKITHDDARAILTHIDTLTADLTRVTKERDEAAAQERAGIMVWLRAGGPYGRHTNVEAYWNDIADAIAARADKGAGE